MKKRVIFKTQGLANIERVSCYDLQIDTKAKISKEFGFKDQIQISSVSIPSNISEGDELVTDKQAVHHFYIANGSTAELLTQIMIGYEIGYITKEDADEIINECKIISVMLTKLIHARSIRL